MYPSPIVMSRLAEEVRRDQRAGITCDRLASRATDRRQQSPSGWVTAATAALRSLRSGLTTQPVGPLQRAQGRPV